MIDNGRLAALPEIAAQFQALVNAQLGRLRRHRLQRLPDRRRAAGRRGGDAREALRPQAQRHGRWSTPELIGGIRVVVGDEVLDTSVKARLEQMKARADRLRPRRPTAAQHSENTMQLNPAEISELIKSRIEGLGASADIKNQGTVVSVTDGIVRVHGLSDAMAGEMLEFPPTRQRPADLRPGAEPRARLGRRGDPGRVRAHLRRRHRQVHGPHPGSAGRPRADRPRGQRARPADRRQGPDQRQDDRRDREGRPGRDRAPVGRASRCRPA